jgi:phosphomannomutase/phosphoglucomutase
MNPQIFRAYDVRGLADRDLSDPVATALGRAYATTIRRAGGVTVCVGRDCRRSSERLFAAFVAGVRASGLNVIDVGVVSTPMVYWSVFAADADGGVQITGSHNPKEYNGFKMMIGKRSLHGDAILALRDLIAAADYAVADGAGAARPAGAGPDLAAPVPVAEDGPALVRALAASPGAGRLARWEGLLPRYIADITGRLAMGPRKLRVALDGGNGAGGPSAMALMAALGLEHDALFTDMDGDFPNHHPDPTVAENLVDLQRLVAETKADVGLAYDGDADRIGVIDERGQILWGDRLLVLLARDLLATHPGAMIVGEVKCSETLFADIAARGGRPLMSAVGHSIIKERMKHEGALLAGEMSGHIFYAERWYGFDDAVYVTARVLEILSRTDRPLSELLSDLPPTFATPELRLDADDTEKFAIVDRALAHYRARFKVDATDGARIDFGDGWGLIRASNTQPVIVLRAEAGSEATLARIQAELEGFVARGGHPA